MKTPGNLMVTGRCLRRTSSLMLMTFLVVAVTVRTRKVVHDESTGDYKSAEDIKIFPDWGRRPARSCVLDPFWTQSGVSRPTDREQAEK